MNYQRIVCIDLEMCCWDDGREPRTGEIIEIGLAEVDLALGEVIQRGQYMVKPDHDEVSEFCTKLTGITQARVDKGFSLEKALELVVRNFGGKQKIYAAWGRDDYVIMNECRAKGIPYPFKEFINLSTLYKVKSRIKNKRFGHYKTMQREGLGWEGQHHSGYDDAFNLARLALHIL